MPTIFWLGNEGCIRILLLVLLEPSHLHLICKLVGLGHEFVSLRINLLAKLHRMREDILEGQLLDVRVTIAQLFRTRLDPFEFRFV